VLKVPPFQGSVDDDGRRTIQCCLLSQIRRTRHTQHVVRQKEIVMDNRFSGMIATAVVAAAASAAISVSVTRTSAQAPVISGVAMKTFPLKTAWGEPDLQGIWTDEFETPLQRPARYANQEFFTEAQRAELDQVRSGILNRRATERDANNG
jgi:hypothetical protein